MLNYYYPNLIAPDSLIVGFPGANKKYGYWLKLRLLMIYSYIKKEELLLIHYPLNIFLLNEIDLTYLVKNSNDSW